MAPHPQVHCQVPAAAVEAIPVSNAGRSVETQARARSEVYTVREQIEMIELAGAEFDHPQVLAGKLSPVFFGSGVNNFGVQLLLDSFLKFSSAPRGRTATLAN